MSHFTSVRTWAGFAYVSFVVDVLAQKIVGWHAMTSRPTELVMVPLRMACWARDQQRHPIVAGQLTAHSDAGSHYVSVRYTEHLALEGIGASIGSVGDVYDNCLMESERVHQGWPVPRRAAEEPDRRRWRPWPGSTGGTTAD